VGEGLSRWINDTFGRLPGCDDELFARIWNECGLVYGGRSDVSDAVDTYSARLICAALTRRQRIFLLLPDDKPHRPALLFATALLRDWWDSLNTLPESPHQVPTVLYFGTTTGFRTQLGQTAIRSANFSLADVFHQDDLGRAGSRIASSRGTVGSASGSPLAHVITVYAPADPLSILARCRPRWIAIDCSGMPRVAWLKPLLQGAAAQNLPVVAWGQNPLAEYNGAFDKTDHIFVWPPVSKGGRRGDLTRPTASLLPTAQTSVHPIVLEGGDVDQLDPLLARATTLLLRATSNIAGRLGQDAVGLHWRLLHCLQQLAIPLELYEAEAPRLWGHKSISQLRRDCLHFRNAYARAYPSFRSDLEELDVLVGRALSQLVEASPPLWNGLANLALEEPGEGEARLITFASRARKQLFLFALLAQLGVSEEDLSEFRTWVVSLDDLAALASTSHPILKEARVGRIAHGLSWRPLVVGVPSPVHSPKLLPVLLQESVDLVHYPHQAHALTIRAHQWERKLGLNLELVVNTLSALSRRPCPHPIPQLRRRIQLREANGLDAGRGRRNWNFRPGPLLDVGDPSRLLAGLLDVDNLEAEDEARALEHQVSSSSSTDDSISDWCSEAVEVNCEDGWHMQFAPEDTVNVVTDGVEAVGIHERHVRALRPGDRVVLIHGQRQQDLYELIISRVHGHPEMQLHLALIRQWPQEFASAYGRWHQTHMDGLEALLGAMQARGSRITSSFTLWLWMNGRILCPQDPRDLRRLAEVLDIEFIRRHHRRIHEAASALRPAADQCRESDGTGLRPNPRRRVSRDIPQHCRRAKLPGGNSGECQ
jgi:hypothetical protein